jgi:hypothetical protein
MLFYVILCYFMLFYVILCYFMLFYVMLFYFILFYWVTVKIGLNGLDPDLVRNKHRINLE